MMAIPFKVSPTSYSVLLVLQDENIARIKLHDPAELVLKMLGEPWQQLQMSAFLITYASPADMARFKELCEQGRQGEGMQFLSRGFKYIPEAGDGSGPQRIF